MAGSGKSSVIQHLQAKYDWPKVYFGEATFDRMQEEGLELNYDNERKTREKLRQEMGMGAYAELALPKLEKALQASQVVLAESLYSWEEYKILKQRFTSAFKVLAVYASPATRFRRLADRRQERPVKDEDEFLARDYSEIENTDKGGPIARADFTVINESALEDCHDQIDRFIQSLGLNS